MAYRIEVDEPTEEAVRRVAAEQLDKALDELDDDALDLHTTVHQVRKRCKKVRGLLRLVRPALASGVYDAENAALRDAARLFSDLRDAEALRETVETLLEERHDALPRDVFETLRTDLRNRRDAAASEADRARLPTRVTERLRAARNRAAGWKFEETGTAAVTGGLKKTYQRGRKALRAAYDAPSPERFHDWRKRAKYGTYHLRLLRDAWRGPIEAWEEAQHQLSDLLGDDHDLAVLAHEIEAKPEFYGPPSTRDLLRGLAETRRQTLQAAARSLGRRLYADKPKAYAQRIGTCVETWRAEDE